MVSSEHHHKFHEQSTDLPTHCAMILLVTYIVEVEYVYSRDRITSMFRCCISTAAIELVFSPRTHE